MPFLGRNCMGREEERKQTHNQIKVGRGEMRLQLIMGLAADVLHESNSLQPVCFHGNRISNYRAQALPPFLSPNKVEADEYELSLAHYQLFLFLFLFFLSSL